ncbi:MAG TPA: hypothetical protein VFY40_05625 [Blastocatellia bacterium]|nr:hypothetical protein [Blastocatellia bacterium]
MKIMFGPARPFHRIAYPVMVFDPIPRKYPRRLGGIAHLSNRCLAQSGLTT